MRPALRERENASNALLLHTPVTTENGKVNPTRKQSQEYIRVHFPSI